eukprot:3031541-Amphidinium_carterae.1
MAKLAGRFRSVPASRHQIEELWKPLPQEREWCILRLNIPVQESAPPPRQTRDPAVSSMVVFWHSLSMQCRVLSVPTITFVGARTSTNARCRPKLFHCLVRASRSLVLALLSETSG